MRNATKNLIALSAAGLASIAGLTATAPAASAGVPASYHLVGQPSVVEKDTTVTMYAPLIVNGDHPAPTVVSLAIVPTGSFPATAADFDQPMAFNVVVPPHAQGVQVPVKVKGDDGVEANETFRLQITGLSQPGGIGAPVVATIQNDDTLMIDPDPQLPDDKAPMPQDDPEEPQDKAPVPQDDDTPEPPADQPTTGGEDADDVSPAADEEAPKDEAETKDVDESELPVAKTTTTAQHDPREDRTEVAANADTEATPVAEDEAGFPMALLLGLGAGAAALTGVVAFARRRRDDEAEPAV